MTISNVTPASGDHLQLGDTHFIDVTNNLYLGVMYHGIESLDIKLQFYTLVDGKFAERIDVDEGDGRVTFSSLNNFGRLASSSSSVGADFSWDQLSTGINNSKYAETVFGAAGTLAAQPYADPTIDSDDTFMQKDAAEVWYSTVHGVYGLTDAGIQAIDFNSNMFALRLDVKAESQVAQGFANWTKDNTADVYMKTEHSDASECKSTTNTVTVGLKTLPTTNVTINKVDEAGAVLAGAKFELKKVGEPSAWTAASFASAEISAYKTLTTATTIAASSTTDTSWTWNNLPVGQYQLIETAPDGYVKATDGRFNVGAKLIANADGTGDVCTSTFKETTNPVVLANVDVKDGSVTANRLNQLDIEAVFQVKKVDQDNEPLAGAVFQYFTDVANKIGMNKDDTTGMHTMPTGQTLEFNKLYTLN